MRLNRTFVALLLALVSWTVAAAPAEYDVSVRKTFAAEQPVKSIAAAPVACPNLIDCIELEKDIAALLADGTGLRIVGAPEVRSLMEKAGFNDLENYEARMILGESLGVDAFALLVFKKAQAEVVQPNLQERPNIKRPMSVKLSGITLQVIARDGTPLAQVSGETYAIDSARSLTSMSTNLFERMIEGAWKSASN